MAEPSDKSLALSGKYVKCIGKLISSEGTLHEAAVQILGIYTSSGS